VSEGKLFAEIKQNHSGDKPEEQSTYFVQNKTEPLAFEISDAGSSQIAVGQLDQKTGQYKDRNKDTDLRQVAFVSVYELRHERQYKDNQYRIGCLQKQSRQKYLSFI
jgi:hypothetical protein